MLTTSAPPKLDREQQAILDQGLLDFMVPWKGLTVDITQAAKSLERSEYFVRTMIAEGRLETFSAADREKERPRILKRSLQTLLIEQANFHPNDIISRLVEIAATLTPAQYAVFQQAARIRREKL